MSIELTDDQKKALTTLLDWYRSESKSKYITLGGLAGTGKTTIISIFRSMIPQNVNVAFIAYTGKAASVLKNKLRVCGDNTNVNHYDYCGTIHSLMYEPVIDEHGDIIGWRRKKGIGDFGLLVIDECSMVSKEIFNDLLEYEIPIICVGDHGQLPPIDSSGFNLMDDPIIKLETIHRFGEKSNLLKISMMARLEGKIRFGEFGDSVIKTKPNDSRVKEFLVSCGDFSNSAILCGFNKSRVVMNKKIRKMIGRMDDDPIVGDRIMCLRNNRNSVDCPIYNGMTGVLDFMKRYDKCYDVKVKMDGEDKPYKGVISKNTFLKEKLDSSNINEFICKKDLELYRKIKSVGNYYGINNVVKEKNTKVYLDIFDYAYAMTVHKSQGSEYKNIFLIEEGYNIWNKGDMWNRWLYTAVTRAKERLFIVSV